ncbi:hypothetical protein AAMO2058_000796500 [Amorphochlora amoebiformis]
MVICKLCCDLYKQPVTLRCLHSFCNSCLRDAQDSKSDTIRCPKCNEEIKGLPYADLRLAKMVKLYQTKVPECANCHEANSSCKCKQCDVALCSACWTLTHSHRIFKDHVRSDILKGEEGFEVCKEHPKTSAEFICIDCVVTVCHACILRGSHVNHKYHSVEVHRRNEQERYAETVAAAQGTKQKLIAAISSVNKRVESLEKNYMSVCAEIEQHFGALQSAIEARQDALLRENKRIRDKKRVNLLEQNVEFEKALGKIAETVDRSKEIVTYAFDDELTKCVDFISERMDSVLELPSTNPLVCTKCDFKGVTCLCPRDSGKVYGTFDDNLVGLMGSYGVVDTKKHATAFARAMTTEEAQAIATRIQSALGSSWGSSCNLM